HLMRAIATRGHELGVHGSYNSFRDADRIRLERRRMIRACDQAGIDPQVAGNRQHYLRWDSNETPDHLASAGVDYDTTGSFADAPGFRYGTSWPFTMWGWQSYGPLTLRQRPLMLMECSVVADRYLGLGYSAAAMDKILDIKEAAMKCGGDFVLLWHNSHFLRPEDREFFRAAIG
ncbi:MAG: MarR family transcriptional regulator, partial [Solirubrobacteraceae bacterium]